MIEFTFTGPGSLGECATWDVSLAMGYYRASHTHGTCVQFGNHFVFLRTIVIAMGFCTALGTMVAVSRSMAS